MKPGMAGRGDVDGRETIMEIHAKHLALALVLTLTMAAPLLSQDAPAATTPDAPAVRTQRQDRARVHQPTQGEIVRTRAEERVRDGNGPDGATPARVGTRVRQGVSSATANRGRSARDAASSSRVRNYARQRARVHRPSR